MVFVTVAIAADESSVSLLVCFGCAVDMFAAVFIHQIHSCCREYLVAACMVVFCGWEFFLCICLHVGAAIGLKKLVIYEFVPICFRTFVALG